MGERWYSNPEVTGWSPGPVKVSFAIQKMDDTLIVLTEYVIFICAGVAVVAIILQNLFVRCVIRRHRYVYESKMQSVLLFELSVTPMGCDCED